MKKKLLFLMFLILAVLIAAPGISLAGTDIQWNGSFEIDDDSDGAADGWGAWNSGGADWGSTIQGDVDNAFEGDSYYQHVTSWGYQGVYTHGMDISMFAPGIEYTVSVMFRKATEADDDTGAWVGFFFHETIPRGEWGLTQTSDSVTITSTSWTEVTYTMTAPVAGDAANRYNNDQSTGTFEVNPASMSTYAGINGAIATIWVDGIIAGPDVSRIAKATDPVPENGAMGFDPASLLQLEWTNALATDAQDEFSWADSVEVEVYFDTNETLVAENNASALILSRQAASNVTTTGLGIGSDKYYWKVQSYAIDAEAVELDGLLGGDVWWFDTANTGPIVDAGDSITRWLDDTPTIAERKVFPTTHTATDDGLPGGTLTYTWNVPGANAVIQSTSDGLAEFRFGQPPAGGAIYVATLSVSDGAETTNDSMVINMKPSGGTGLVAHWTLDDASGADVSGNSRTGTVVGAVAVAGQIDGALSFDSANGDYVDISGSGCLTDPNLIPTWADSLANGMTVSCWMKSSTDGSSDAWAGIVSRDNTAWELVRNNNDDVKFHLQADVAPAATTGAGNVDTVAFDSEWHHIVGTFDGGIVNIYIDGMLADTQVAVESAIATGPANIMIGRTVDAIDDQGETIEPVSSWLANNFSGLIDDARIYDVAIPLVSINGSPGVRQMYVDGGGKSSCGGQYAATDVNQDCYSNLGDFAVVCGDWLTCQNIADPACD